MAKKKIDPATEAIAIAVQNIEDVLTELYNMGFDDGFEEAEAEINKLKEKR